MSSYLSNILTNTTSKYNTLRQNLTSSEADGDTEDDSHISRVLRAYYTEKGRQFPQWLPPDPKRTVSSQPVTSTFTSSLRQQSNSPTLGSGGQQQKGSLSDLWDQPAQKAPAPQQPMSLRRQAAERSGTSFRGNDTLQPSQAQPQARLLPSQRAGSYQSVASQHQYNDSSPTPGGGSVGAGAAAGAGAGAGAGGGTAQERLKARLWGRSGSSTNLNQAAAQQQGQQPQQYGRDRFTQR